MRPTDEMFVTTDPHDGWKMAASDVTGQPDRSSFGSGAGEPEPIRPEGPQVRSPGWSGQGDMPSENAAANKMHAWTNSANEREAASKQNLEQYMDKSSSKERGGAQPSLDQYIDKPERSPASPEQDNTPSRPNGWER